MRMPGMMLITVQKDELLEKLEENRRKHRTVFEDALHGYADKMQDILEGYVNDMKRGRIPVIQIGLIRPEDHTRDYDRVIGMLKMHQGDVFELDEDTYRQYVDDDWGWKRQWLATSTEYAAGSVQANYKAG
jgi:hypothetical protein